MTKAIQALGPNEFFLKSGANKMTLSKKSNGNGWTMKVDNPSSRAHGNMARLFGKDFDSLPGVETKYRSWRGIAALVEGSQCN